MARSAAPCQNHGRRPILHCGALARRVGMARWNAPSRANETTMNAVCESQNPPEMRSRRAAKGNCVVVRRGGKQPEAEPQPAKRAVARLNSIRPGNLGSPLDNGEPCARARIGTVTPRIKRPMPIGWGVLARPPASLFPSAASVAGGRMWRRAHGITLRAAAAGGRRKAAGGSRQSIHSSDEAGNDRGAKGCREVNP
jgi:hypothetical protein